MEGTENLFQDFSPVTGEEWKQKIVQDLKGLDYDRAMIWQTENDFSVRPFYMSEELEKFSQTESAPGQFPYTRARKGRTDNSWDTCQEIFQPSAGEANQLARAAVANGGHALTLRLYNNLSQWEQYIESLDLTAIRLHIDLGSYSKSSLSSFYQTILTENMSGSVHFDPIGVGLDTGQLPYNGKELAENLKQHYSQIRAKNKNFYGITVDSTRFQNAGSSQVNELAFALALGSEYIAVLQQSGVAPADACRFIKFLSPVSSGYFTEIAKFRAFRRLWSTILSAYGVAAEDIDFHIHGITSASNQTLYDPHVNLLRGTTEAMSAAAGGCQTISVLPFDLPYSHGDAFSQRIARNTQHLLRYESYMDKVLDPASGSYYIENLTESLSQKAWSIFQEIEGKGGFLQVIQQGWLQEQIQKDKERKQQEVAIRKRTILGTNQFPLRGEKAAGKGSRQLVAVDSDGFSGEKISSLTPFRLAEPYEELRLTTEKYSQKTGKTPAAYLLPIGNLAMRIARATFAANFFSCAGFDVIESNGFDNPIDGVKDFEAKGGDVLVICSSDAEYSQFAGEICSLARKQKPEQMILVAGYPKDAIEQLKQAGVDDFIHVKTNALEFLQQIQQKLAIKE